MQLLWATLVSMAERKQIREFWLELERLGKVLGRVGPDEICCEGLTIRQCAILRTLANGEGARLSDLAQSAGITQSAMTRAIEKLERRGLVQRLRNGHNVRLSSKNNHDRRSATVELRPSGRQLRSRLDLMMVDRAGAIFHAIPEDKREEVLEALRTLNAAMQETPCCPLNEPVDDAAEDEG